MVGELIDKESIENECNCSMDDAGGCYDNRRSVGGFSREIGRGSKGCCSWKENEKKEESIHILSVTQLGPP